MDKKDEDKIKTLFNELLTALISEGKDKKFRKSLLAVAKALHILAPDFFPLWDNVIAKAYECYWINASESVQKYVDFCWKSRKLMECLKKQNMPKDNDKSWLKVIDEYNYAKFTYEWV